MLTFTKNIAMTTQKIDLSEFDDQDLTEEFLQEQHFVDPEIPENDGPWTKPQLTPKSVTTADKRIAIENLMA